MNLEWQNPNTEKPKTIEKNEDVGDEENIEQKLSPEQIGQIMTKVQDIHTDGIAFSVFGACCYKGDDFSVPSLSGVENVLSEGLLGNSYYWSNEDGSKSVINKDGWIKNVRKHKNALVHFNITGRMSDIINYEQPIQASAWMKDDDRDKIAILFDIDKYREDTPFYQATKDKLNNRTFRMSEDYADKYVDSMHGFTLSHRVPPRFFKGLVIKLVTGETYKDEYGNVRGKICLDPAKYDEQADNIGKILHKTSKSSDSLIPIYDIAGNLRWPKKMMYEEVKKFIEERDVKNTNKEEK